MLQVRNLCKTFHRGTVNEKNIFNGFSVDIAEGDFVTIIGSNGAGKSTFLNLISGAIEADEGSILLNHDEMVRMPEYKRSKVISRVFQDPTLGTSPSMTILENLSMAINKGKKFNLSMGVSKKDISRFREILSQLALGLENMVNTQVGMLSGGQRQALSLVMATISDPKLLLLDEHTAALDPKTSERIIGLTEDMVSQKKITTLMITHNLHHAIEQGNRLLMLHQGRIVLDIRGDEKKNLTIEKLLSCFEKVQLDKTISDRALFS